MPLIALSKPFWARQLSNPFGFLAILALPLLVTLIWRLSGGPPDRWTSLLLLGWTLGGLLPAALNGRRDDAVESRWRSLPVGAAERWFGAFLALFPLPFATTLLLVLAGMAVGPASQHNVYLLTVGALVAGVMVAFGLAIGAWSRSSWQLAGLLGLALLASAWVLLPGVGGWPAELVPTGQAKLALLALPKGAIEVAVPLVKLGMMGLAFAVLGIIGVGRR